MSDCELVPAYDGLPTPVEGETLFSWCARYHRLSGAGEPRQTSRNLFGVPGAALRHDFPVRLDYLIERIGPLLGSAEEVICRRTLLPFFSPFLTQTALARAVECMRSGRDAHIKRLLGAAAGWRGNDAPLKACPICMERDRLALKFSVWHQRHQWPTTLMCAEHGCALQVVTDPFMMRGVKRLCFPHEVEGQFWRPALPLGCDVAPFRALDDWTARIVRMPPSSLSTQVLRLVYMLGAKSRDYLALEGSLRMQALCRDLEAHFRHFAGFREFAFLNHVGGNSGGFVGSLARDYKGLHHPAKHLLLMIFLFKDWEAFLVAYGQAEAAARTGCLDELSRSRYEPGDALEAFVRAGMSVNAASSTLELPVVQAVRYLQRHGVPYRKRRRIVRGDKEPALVALLMQGVDRGEIASKLGIRRSFIKDYLATRPLLKSAWEAAAFARERASHRERFLGVLRENPGLPVKRIRLVPKNGFQWLYNNDRDWLEEQLPAIWRQQSR